MVFEKETQESDRMKQSCYSKIAVAAALVATVTTLSPPLAAQIDLSGNWAARFFEDQPERIPGPELGDYLGLPINEDARRRADAWSPSRLTMPEQQCRVHVVPYIYRGPLELRVWVEKDPESQEVIAIRNYISTYEQNRTIWMDNRPHPPEYAMHTWMGFSTGKWEGEVLTVFTDHIKTGWIRRNGVVESDHATENEHFIRHGNYLTHVSIVTDPIYLTEPLIKTQDFVYDTEYVGNWLYPCESVEEVVGRPPDAVPNILPGQNDFIKEYSERHPEVPPQAARGGAETMYPEYKLKIKAMKQATK
jgi:hypothetical protein